MVIGDDTSVYGYNVEPTADCLQCDSWMSYTQWCQCQ